MLKILWNRGEIAPEEQFLLLFTIFSYLMLDFYVKTRIGFSLRNKRLIEITEVELTRVDCISNQSGWGNSPPNQTDGKLMHIYFYRNCIFLKSDIHVIVIDLFNETVWFDQRGGRSPSRLLNRQSS